MAFVKSSNKNLTKYALIVAGVVGAYLLVKKFDLINKVKVLLQKKTV